MSRTAAPGGRIVVDASTAPVDTAGYGIVSILVLGEEATVTVKVGETTTVDTAPVTTLIDPDTGVPVDTSAWEVPAGEDGALLSYIGECRYVQATASTGDSAYVILEEARRTTPIE